MRHAATPLRHSRVANALAGTRFGQAITVLGRVGSTSDVLLARARANAPDGAVIAADTQTGGRGRRGTTWISPARQGLYFSCLLRRVPPMDQLRLLAPCAGLAVVSVLRASGVPALLKWPNDVLAHGGKLAGILVDVCTEGTRTHAVIGIGVNLRRDALTKLPEAALPAAALAAGTNAQRSDGLWLREELLCALLHSLEAELAALERGEFERLRANYRSVDALRGHNIVALCGENTVRGRVLECDPVHGLLLQTADQSQQRLDPARTHITWVEGLSATARLS